VLAAPVPAPPTGAFNVLTHAGAQVKDKSAPRLRHAWESYPGVVPPTSALCGHPRHCTALCGKVGVSSMTLCYPLSYGPSAASSKEDGGTLEKGTDAYSTLAQDNAVTSDQ
jgi:hypothetical protein